ncbi:hypothetical protein [Gemmata massiliana]|nr:hypothetical protein [Gemmata massiliana]
MRQVPVFADRFWKLKPRRNELRTAAGTDWCALMKYGTECEPVFRHGIPDGWRERWRLIREFTERWHRVPMSDVGGRQSEIAEVEARLRRTLPPSVREWVAFIHDVQHCRGVIHDECPMGKIWGQPAVSLLLQTEDDYNWAVPYCDLDEVDPPVQGYHWGDVHTFIPDTENTLREPVTVFAFNYLMGHARGIGGFGTGVEKPTPLFSDLESTFTVRVKFGNSRFYEADNILVRIDHPNWGAGTYLQLRIARPVPPEQIPAFLWHYARDGGSFHGICTPPS